MTKILLGLLAALCLLMWPAMTSAEKQPQPKLPKGWKFSLPAGNAAAGKTAFRELQCYECHRVPGQDLPPARTAGGVGPDLVPAYSKLPREFLAESIINVHKYISGNLQRYRGRDMVSSKMRDYNSIITVRQLLDIVQFLKELGPKHSAGAAH